MWDDHLRYKDVDGDVDDPYKVRRNEPEDYNIYDQPYARHPYSRPLIVIAVGIILFLYAYAK